MTTYRTDEYSPLKIAHHTEKLSAIKQDRITAPIHVQIIPTNRCNQNCSFCAYRRSGYTTNANFHTRSEIPCKKLFEIIESCKSLGVKAIEFTGGGESTLHPQFSKAIEAAADFAEVGLVTNGVEWTALGDALAYKLSWIRFSLDAATSDTYRLTRCAHPDTLMKIRAMISRLRQRAPNLTIGVGFVVHENNWQEIYAACKNARDDGAHNIRISAVFQSLDAEYFKSFFKEAADLCRQARDLGTDNFKVIDLFGDRYEDMAFGSPAGKRCYVQELQTIIGADQCVYRCCNTAYSATGFLASLERQTLAEAWFSSDCTQKLRAFDSSECQRCMFNTKNAIVDYLISTSPKHVNFL